MKFKRRKSFCRPMLLMLGLLSFLSLSAQEGTLRGTVTDTTGETVIGANVRVKGTDNGTITDFNGTYVLSNVNTQSAVLVFSFIGYQNLEVPVNGRTTVNVVLQDDTQALDEVIVIGYGQVRRGDATGSLTSIKADPSVRGLAPNAQDMMIGKIAGMNITTGGGSPTAGATIRIRGGSSLTASNDPLIIVDGVPLDNSGIGGVGNILSTINPTDIESFTVLKDASATAIYGSRASNGVILITTRKGTKGKVTVNYDANVSFSMRTKEIDVLSTEEFRSFMTENFKGAATEDAMHALMGDADTDWQSEIFRTTVNTEHNLSVYGSTGNLPYRVSLGYTKLDGILKTSHMERYTGSVNLSPSFFQDHLKLNLNGKLMHIKSRFANTGAISTAALFDPTQPVYDANSPYGGYFTWTDPDGTPSSLAPSNPVALLELTKDTSKATNFIGNAQFDYKVHFLPDLRLNLNMGIDYSKSDGGKYIPEYAASEFNAGGYDGNWEQTRRNMLLEFYAQYVKDLDFLDSRIDIMGGYSWQHYHREGNNRDYRISKFDENGDPLVITISDYVNNNYLVSFFGRLNYSISDKYLFTFTLRNDGSSRFSSDNRWGLFPAAAFAWRANNEGFLSEVKALSDLKVRLGWGVTGQQDINQGDYPYLGSYQYAVGEQTNQMLGYKPDGTPNWVSVIRPLAYNPDIKWEETTTYNLGIDYGFLKNRINGSVDFYYRKTKDLINAATKTAAGTNFNQYVVANIGSLENRGAEVAINAIPVLTKDWQWEIGTNFAYNKNKILKLTFGDNTNSERRDGRKIQKVGYATDMFYVYQQVYDETGFPIEGAYVDQNNDGVRNDEDYIIYKRATPDWTMGMNTKLSWKSWDLSLAGHGNFGNYNYNNVAASNAATGTGNVFQTTFMYNRPSNALYTRYTTTQGSSSYYIQNASFFRIDNITLGWSFRTQGHFPFRGRIYTSVQNPVVFTRYKGMDPEISGGIDNNFYPRPLTVLLGFNLTF